MTGARRHRHVLNGDSRGCGAQVAEQMHPRHDGDGRQRHLPAIVLADGGEEQDGHDQKGQNPASHSSFV